MSSSSINPGVSNLMQMLSSIDSPVLSSQTAVTALEQAPSADIVQLSNDAMQVENLDALFGFSNSPSSSPSSALASLASSAAESGSASSTASAGGSTAAGSTAGSTAAETASYQADLQSEITAGLFSGYTAGTTGTLFDALG
jgi:hypothetical protein